MFVSLISVLRNSPTWALLLKNVSKGRLCVNSINQVLTFCHTAARTTAPLKIRVSYRVQNQLKREQVLLQKRMQQLNEDEERKKTTLAKQHEATSRIAAITKSPKSFAFGSSTPRTLAYLDNLPKSEQQYDKKLRPLEGASQIASPLATVIFFRNLKITVY